MNKPNLTLAAFCANLAWLKIEDKIKITLDLAGEHDDSGDFSKERFLTLKNGANGKNLAVYGQWYVTCIDYNSGQFDLIVAETPAY